MANLITWLSEKLLPGKSSDFLELASTLPYIRQEFDVRRVAFHQCVNLIANAVACCEFKTYVKGEFKKANEYYRWNYQPNFNQNKSAFLDSMITKLFTDNEVLVINDDKTGQLIVADTFTVSDAVLKEKVYTQVSSGTLTFNKAFRESDVIHIVLNAENIKPLLEGMYSCYEEILSYTLGSYKRSRGEKAVVKLSSSFTNNPTAKENLKVFKDGFVKFSEAEAGLFTIDQGMEYLELGKSKYQIETSRDIKAQMDDIIAYTARAFQIPPPLMTGTIEGLDTAIDQFLTFCIDPLCQALEEEINRKVYGKSVLKGTFISVDTTTMKHTDVLSVSTAVDKLIASGALTINEAREAVGYTPTLEPEGNIHWITKNYATIAEVALSGNNETGGDKDEQVAENAFIEKGSDGQNDEP